MEYEPQLEARAKFIIARADEMLQLPDQVQLLQRYSSHLGGDYFLELRSQSDSRENAIFDGNTRYIYLEGPHESGRCRPALSVNLNRITQENHIQGLIENPDSIDIALSAMPDTLTEEAQLLQHLKSVMTEEADSGSMNPESIQQLETSFMEILSKGSTVARKDLYRKHEDGMIVSANTVQIEGSLQHIWGIELEDPLFRIIVGRKDQKNHTVLEQSRDGKFESFEEIANGMERKASFAKPENVHRDDSGKIIAISGNPFDEVAVINAERSMGLRNLHPDRVDLIERYVRETFIT